MIRATPGRLPVLLQEPDRLHWIETCIVHPVMRLAEPREVVRLVVRGIVVEMRDGQAGLDLQTADSTALERVMLVGDTTGLRLISALRNLGVSHVDLGNR